MNLRFRKSDVERRLRAAAPRPAERVVRSIADAVERANPGRRTRPQLRLAGVTLASAVGLLAIGGLGFAMNYAGDFVTGISHRIVVGTHTTVRTIVLNPANDEYGTTTATTTTTAATTTAAAATTTTQTTTTTTTTTEPATTTNSDGSKSTEVPPSSSGSVTVAPPTDSSQQVSVDWSPSTFTKPVVISIDPTPPVALPAFAGPSGGSIVSITVTDPSTGATIHKLDAPLEVVFKNAPKGFVPAVSEDGVNFRALTEISGPPLPAAMQDGFYRVGNDVHVITRHLTQFAVLYKANLSTSESGRKTPAAGSGKFGDPTRIHIGAPVVDVVGNATGVGDNVDVSVYVDEQVALYVQVLTGSKQLILGGSSTIRKHTIGGPARHTLHTVVLRPGTINLQLHVPGLVPGAKVRIVAIDYDGHKVMKTVTVD